jgi:hypothetical protein
MAASIMFAKRRATMRNLGFRCSLSTLCVGQGIVLFNPALRKHFSVAHQPTKQTKMAVYQYYLAVIPKQGIEKKHDFIPNEIGVSTETGFFESDAGIYWKVAEMKADDIVTKVDVVIKRVKWRNDKTSFNWEDNSDEIENDAVIYLDEETLTIREFSFRADLREKDFAFLKNMIALGKEKDWLFMDRKGKLMKPDFEEIKKSIRESNAYSFLADPIKFLKNIDNKNK